MRRDNPGERAALLVLALAVCAAQAKVELPPLDIAKLTVQQLRWSSLVEASARSQELRNMSAEYLKSGGTKDQAVLAGVDSLLASLLETYPSKQAKYKNMGSAARNAQKRAMMGNVKRIADINQRNLLKGGGWWAQATEFLDWSDTERQKLIMPGVIELGLGRGPTFLPPDLPLATGVDWRLVKKVGAIRNQYSCGSCWAMAAASALESRRMINRGEDFNASNPLHTLSVQQLVDCVKRPTKAKWNGGQYNSSQCTGGYSDEAMDYAWQFGIVSDSKYPYVGTGGSCSRAKIGAALLAREVYSPTPAAPSPTTSGFVRVASNNVEALKAAVQLAPVAVYIRVEPDFHDYGGGLYDAACSGTKLNHAVNIVGWREPPFAGASPYWIVRNSWGSSWGADGYMQLLMDKTAGSEGLCRSHKYSYYPNTSV